VELSDLRFVCVCRATHIVERSIIPVQEEGVVGVMGWEHIRVAFAVRWSFGY
jgi:hypothetical protein